MSRSTGTDLMLLINVCLRTSHIWLARLKMNKNHAKRPCFNHSILESECKWNIMEVEIRFIPTDPNLELKHLQLMLRLGTTLMLMTF